MSNREHPVQRADAADPAETSARPPDRTLAHEVNNHLAVVVGNLDYLEDVLANIRSLAISNDVIQQELVEALDALRDVRMASDRIRLAVAVPTRAAEPRASIVNPPEPMPTEPMTGIRRSLAQLERPHVLVIDDDPAVVQALERVLREYELTTVQRPQEALDLIASGRRFDAILTDMTMPVMTGRELYVEIQRVEPSQAARVVFVTGGAPAEPEERFLGEVPQPVVRKPFDAAALRELVQAVIRSR